MIRSVLTISLLCLLPIAVLAGEPFEGGTLISPVAISETNLIDMAQVKSMLNTPVTTDTARYDVNADGDINLIDAALVKSLLGGGATCP